MTDTAIGTARGCKRRYSASGGGAVAFVISICNAAPADIRGLLCNSGLVKMPVLT